jgi:hypothetical protein
VSPLLAIANNAQQRLVFTADLSSNTRPAADTKVNLHESDSAGNLGSFIKPLQDLGNVTNGDAFKNDGVYSAVYVPPALKPGVKFFAVEVSSVKSGVKFTLLVSVNVVAPPAASQVRAFVADAKIQQQQIEALLASGSSIQQAVSQIAQLLQQQPDVDSVAVKPTYVTWTTSNGLSFVAGQSTSLGDFTETQVRTLQDAAETFALQYSSDKREREAGPMQTDSSVGPCKIARGDIVLLSPVLTPLHTIIAQILVSGGLQLAGKLCGGLVEGQLSAEQPAGTICCCMLAEKLCCLPSIICWSGRGRGAQGHRPLATHALSSLNLPRRCRSAWVDTHSLLMPQLSDIKSSLTGGTLLLLPIDGTLLLLLLQDSAGYYVDQRH